MLLRLNEPPRAPGVNDDCKGSAFVVCEVTEFQTTGYLALSFLSSDDSDILPDELLFGAPRCSRGSGCLEILIEPSGYSWMQRLKISWSRFSINFSNSN